jgi:arabinose-5-phosphate isomerase
LLRVEEVMRQGAGLRIAPDGESVRSVFAHSRRQGRRTGAVMLVDEAGRLSGLFTDSDLARLIEARRDEALDRPISEVMTRNPITLPVSARVSEALALFGLRRISELPVLAADGRPVGLLDITDLIGVAAEEVAREPGLARVGA